MPCGYRGEGWGQGREGRREWTSLVTIVQWLGAAWRNKAAVSANSVMLRDQQALQTEPLPIAGPTRAMGVRSTMEGNA